MPTILEVAEVNHPAPERPRDGISLTGLFDGTSDDEARRNDPLFFRYKTKAAVVDGTWKLLTNDYRKGQFELYDLAHDIAESDNVANNHPKRFQSLKMQLRSWLDSTDASEAGRDYPEDSVDADHPDPMFWVDRADYQQYLPKWKDRWEYKTWIERRKKTKK
jgi:hypothetical protein